MKPTVAGILLASIFVVAAATASAQDETPQAPIPFEGGTLTIAEGEDLEKVLAFDGNELAGGYVLYYDRTVEIGGRNVALFQTGDGGNQCGTATVIVWKPEDGAVKSVTAGDDCGSPAPALTGSSIYFVPFLLPGASKPVQQWTPNDGLTIAGTMSYTPEPGTDWKDLDPAKLYNIVDAFKNEAVYAAGQDLLGDAITDFATGLLVGGGTESTPSGIFYSSGCVPHACGGADAFMAVDAKNKALYLAQQSEDPPLLAWPALDAWPADVKSAMQAALGR